MELWDACDKEGRMTGDTLVRGEPIPEGLYHLVVGILVEHEDGRYLLMLRDPNKKTWPGYYEASAGGSVLKGEPLVEAAKRELLEETGIRAETLIPLYEEISYGKQVVYRGFVCVTDWEQQNITLQEGETVGWLWVTRQELLEMVEEVPPRCAIHNGVRAYLGLPDGDYSDEFKLLIPPKVIRNA